VTRVILVDKNNEPVGSMEKLEAHQKGLLHRAFSIFIFNEEGHLLLQQRALSKYHSGGLWSNSCCSHPEPGEEIAEAASKRLWEELGISTELTEVFSFIYRMEFDNGLTEHEFDHVFIGQYNGELYPDNTEVRDYCFMPIEDIKASIEMFPDKYTAWFRIALPRLESYLTPFMSEL